MGGPGPSSEVVARAETLREAFIEAVRGLFALAVDPDVVDACEVREVRAHGASLEALLAHWIGECSYVHEIEGFVCHSIELAVFDVESRVGGEPLRLHAYLHGEELDPARHRPARTIEAVSARDITIHPVGDGYEIRLALRS